MGEMFIFGVSFHHSGAMTVAYRLKKNDIHRRWWRPMASVIPVQLPTNCGPSTTNTSEALIKSSMHTTALSNHQSSISGLNAEFYSDHT